jgi:hypothetical protein
VAGAATVGKMIVGVFPTAPPTVGKMAALEVGEAHDGRAKQIRARSGAMRASTRRKRDLVLVGVGKILP